MGGPRQWLVVGLGVLVALVLAVALAVVLLLDPARVRDQLVSIAREQTGRDLQIAHPVELTFFPWLGVALREVSLGNAPGLDDAPLARVAELHVGVKVLPLLAGRLEVASVSLRGLDLNLVRGAQGEASWDGLRQRSVRRSDDATGDTAPSSRGLAAFLIGGIELSGGRVAWHDQRTRTGWVLDDLHLETGTIAVDRDVPVRFSGRVRVAEASRNLLLAGTSHLQLSERDGAVQLPDLDLSVQVEGDGLPAGRLQIRARARARYDRESSALELAPLDIDGAGLRLRGEVRGTRLDQDPSFAGRVEVVEARPRMLLALLGAEVATADPAVLDRFTATLPFQADRRAVAIEGLELRLDDTTVTGRLGVTDPASGAASFDLVADRLNVDRYLPPAPMQPLTSSGQHGATRPGPVDAAGAGTVALRGLAADGSLRVGILEIGGAQLSEVQTRWRARDGVITQSTEAKLYGGAGQSTATLDVTRTPPVATLKGTLLGIDLRGLLVDATGEARLRGTATVDADLVWNGLSAAEIRRSLGGSARLALHDGALRGFDLDALVQNALAAVTGSKAPGSGQETVLAELTASATAHQGVLTNRDLQATSRLLRVTGGGTIDLPANRIDYLAKARLRDSAAGQLGQRIELGDAAIPVRIAGALDAPSVKLDVDAVLRGRAVRQIERRIDEKLEGEWGDKVKKLLGR